MPYVTRYENLVVSEKNHFEIHVSKRSLTKKFARSGFYKYPSHGCFDQDFNDCILAFTVEFLRLLNKRLDHR